MPQHPGAAGPAVVAPASGGLAARCRQRRSGRRRFSIGRVILGFVLINLMEFKNLAQETCAVCNLSFWSISAVWQFFPTASLSENS